MYKLNLITSEIDSGTELNVQVETTQAVVEVDVGSGITGEDGATYTPSVSADGVISWTNNKDKENPDPVNIKGEPGAKGDRGDPGKDGISPTVDVEAISGGHRVSITDVNGTKSFSVMDGADGSNIEYTETDPTVPAWAKAASKPTYTASEIGAAEKEHTHSEYLTSFTETDPTVPAWAKEPNKPAYTAADVGLGNVDNIKQYSASNPPPYPVTSVNGQTGDVIIESGGSDPITPDMIGAAPSYHASESREHGVGTANKYGHLKVADIGNVFTGGEENLLDIAIELPTGDPSIDLEPYAFGAHVGYVVSNILYGYADDNSRRIASHDTQINTLQNQTLKQTDRQSIINDALNALAGADSSDAGIAALGNRVGMVERKVANVAEDIATLQEVIDEIESQELELFVKVACRLVQIERILNLRPPISTDGWDTTTDFDGAYDGMEWQ